jgi:RNA polymerase sigma-70 factor (ECF subfamily)
LEAFRGEKLWRGIMAALSAEELVKIVDARFAALVLYARSWNCNAAEDIVQEAFLKLVNQKQSPDNPAAWLYKTVRNEAVSRSRKTDRQRKHETAATKERPEWFTVSENTLLSQEAAEKLQELSPNLREVVVLRIWSQLTFDEIAELTATPKTSVHRLYHEALEELRQKLE